MRKVFFALVALLFVTIFFQFFFAAFGAFDRPRDTSSFEVHRALGTFAIPALSLLATVAAALARAPKKLIGMAILPVGMIVIQMLLRATANSFVSDAGETSMASNTIFGIHAIVGLLTMAIVAATMKGAREFAGIGASSGSAPAETPKVASQRS